MLAGLSTSPRLVLPRANGAKSTDGFRRMAPEGLRPRLNELLAEPGAAGSKSEFSSPAVYCTPVARSSVPLTPLRSSSDQGRRRRSRSVLSSPQPWEGVELGDDADKKSAFVKDVLCRLPSGLAVAFDSEPTSPAEAASPIRTRSFESTFGPASPDHCSPIASSAGVSLRRLVDGSPPHQPDRPKSLKPLRGRSFAKTISRIQVAQAFAPPPISVTVS